jgi:G:T/U-mismatch repair DNA glycosylase
MPVTVGAIGAVASPIIGGLFGSRSAKKQARAAADARAAALAEYAKVVLPGISEQELDLILPELQGEINPELNQIETLQDSQQIQDPAIKEMQMKALEDMAGISKGGLREEDMAAFREMRRNVESENQANQEKILQDMQRRGTMGSGMELAAKLQANQAATDRMSAGGDRLAQEAATRALQALTQTSNMGGQLTDQNFREQSAKDAINQFNTRNRQDVGNANVSAKNAAQSANLAARQNLADQRVNMQNQQQQYNKGLIQQNYNNQMGMASAKAGQYAGVAQASDQAASNAAQSGAQLGAGVGSAFAGMMNYFGKDKKTT